MIYPISNSLLTQLLSHLNLHYKMFLHWDFFYFHWSFCWCGSLGPVKEMIMEYFVLAYLLEAQILLQNWGWGFSQFAFVFEVCGWGLTLPQWTTGMLLQIVCSWELVLPQSWFCELKAQFVWGFANFVDVCSFPSPSYSGVILPAIFISAVVTLC